MSPNDGRDFPFNVPMTAVTVSNFVSARSNTPIANYNCHVGSAVVFESHQIAGARDQRACSDLLPRRARASADGIHHLVRAVQYYGFPQILRRGGDSEVPAQHVPDDIVHDRRGAVLQLVVRRAEGAL